MAFLVSFVILCLTSFLWDFLFILGLVQFIVFGLGGVFGDSEINEKGEFGSAKQTVGKVRRARNRIRRKKW